MHKYDLWFILPIAVAGFAKYNGTKSIGITGIKYLPCTPPIYGNIFIQDAISGIDILEISMLKAVVVCSNKAKIVISDIKIPNTNITVISNGLKGFFSWGLPSTL